MASYSYFVTCICLLLLHCTTIRTEFEERSFGPFHTDGSRLVALEEEKDSEECETRLGEHIFCPSENDPVHFTKCCPDYDKNETVILCCSGSPKYEDSLVMMISLFVMLLCLTLSICSVVCCFWSPCPLYSVCRMNYVYGDIVADGKEEESLNLPPDDCQKNNYTPLHIKVKAVEED